MADAYLSKVLLHKSGKIGQEANKRGGDNPATPSLPALPHCDELFMRFFDRWYDEESRTRRRYKATRPDIETIYVPGISATEVSLCNPHWHEAKEAVEVMIDATHSDWPMFFGVSLPPTLQWVGVFDRHFGRTEIHQLLAQSDPTSFSNAYLVYCCEFGAVIGDVFCRLAPDLQWLYDWPYWESAIFDSITGSRVNVFHWAIKKMSEYGVADGFARKTQAVLEYLRVAAQKATHK